MRFRLSLVTLLTAISLPSAALAGLTNKSSMPVTPPAGSEATVTGLIVKMKASSGRMAASRLTSLSSLAGMRLQQLRTMSNGASVLGFPASVTADQARLIAARIESSPLVAYASPDYRRTRSATPNDPGYPDQWGLFAPSSSYETIPTVGGINMPTAWDIVTGSTDTVIAVLDTGIISHPDIAAKLLPGYDFISDVFNANDGSGRDSNPTDAGDWVTEEETAICGGGASDSSWHGTFVAGIAAASSNNSLGMTGVDWNARVLPVRVLGKCGGSDSDIIDAVRWAAGLSVAGAPANPNPADVINMSLGGFSECSAAWQEAVQEVLSVGTTIVAATGNDGFTQIDSPSSCPGIIAVTANTIEGINAIYANIGEQVAISAPGGGPASANNGTATGSGALIGSLSNSGLTTADEDTYSAGAGTSYAAPHVAGVVALLRGMAPTMHPNTIRSLITSNARPHPADTFCTQAATSGLCGAGLLDATATLQAASISVADDNTAPIVTAPSSAAGREDAPLTFQISGSDADDDTLNFGAVVGTLPSGAVINTTTGVFTWAEPVAGDHVVQVLANDGLINSTPVEVAIHVDAVVKDIPPLSNAVASKSKGGGAIDLLVLLLAAGGLLQRLRRK